MSPVYIHGIATGNPPTAYSQAEARERTKEQLDGRRAKRIVHRLYTQSGIERRFTAVDTFLSPTPGELFAQGSDGKLTSPSTGQRNARFTEVSRELTQQVARRLMDQCENFAPTDVTHVITVSCTGFYNPGPDLAVVHALELPAATQRFHLGFMGCYAAFPALRMAQQFCQADPDAVVLIVCVELCTLHIQLDEDDMDGLLAASLFGDGAAAALVSARPPSGPAPVLEMQGMFCDLVTAGEDAMAWSVGDRGFDIALSSYVPHLLGSNMERMIAPLLQAQGLRCGDVAAWAVHPGGRAILDQVRDALNLDESKLAASRRVLRDYGNMSSATILFVLKALLDEAGRPDRDIIAAMAFGPGLTVEFALLHRLAASTDAWDGRTASLTACHPVS